MRVLIDRLSCNVGAVPLCPPVGTVIKRLSRLCRIATKRTKSTNVGVIERQTSVRSGFGRLSQLCSVFAIAICLIRVDAVCASEALVALYNRGNEYYRAGDFDAAISAYERVIAQGLNNGEVYYNLGNAYFKNAQLGRAILSYERALKLMPSDRDVLANLQFANAQKIDRESEDEVNILTRVLQAIFAFFTLNTLAVMVCAFVFLIGGVAVCWIFVPVRRLLWGGLLVVFVGGLLGSAAMLAFKAYQHSIPKAIILVDEAIGRSGPGTDFLQVFALHEGTKVEIERVEGRWLLVRLRSGLGGWIEARALERI